MTKLFDQIAWTEVKSILNSASDQAPPGPKSAMAVEHWLAVVKILRPSTTETEVEDALKSLVEDGLFAFDPAVTINLLNGSPSTIAGYYAVE